MKPQKKVACCLLAFMMIIFLVSCGKQKEEPADMDTADYTAFQTVQKKMKELEDASFKIYFKKHEKGDGLWADSEEYVATGTRVMSTNNHIDMKMQIIEQGDVGIRAIIFQKDDDFYVKEDSGLRLKLDMPTTRPDSWEGFSMLWIINAQNLLSISKDMISSLELSRAEKDTTYSFQLKENDNTVDYVKKSTFGVVQDIDDEGMRGGINTIVPKVKVEIVTGEDNMAKSMSMDGVLVVTYKYDPEREVYYTYQLDMEYKSINTGLKIKFPDFSNYVVESGF